MTKPYVVVDLETTDLTGDTILGYSWAFENGEYGSEAYDPDQYQSDFLVELLTDYTPIFHNAKFDVRVLRKHQFKVTRYHDTMLMAWVYDPTHDQYGLDAVATRYGTANKMAKPESWDTWTDYMAEYAAQDAASTMQLFKLLRKELRKDKKAWQLYTHVELPYLEVILEMESTGFYIDSPKLQRLIGHLSRKSEALTNKAQQMVGLLPKVYWDSNTNSIEVKPAVEYKKRVPLNGTMFKARTSYKVPLDYVLQPGEVHVKDNKVSKTITREEWAFYGGITEGDTGMATATKYDHCLVTEFNPDSNVQVAYVLEQQYGWKPEKFTPTGQPQTGTDVLEGLKFPLAKVLTTLAEVNKILGSFLIPFRDMRDRNGVLHGEFVQTGTKTGRLSSRRPNLQNIPARGSYGAQVRSLVTVPNQQWQLVGVDLSNIEGRVLAHYLSWRMRDDSLRDIFEQGLDFHSENTINWGLVPLFYGDKASDLIAEYRRTGDAKLLKKARNAAKTALYAVLYGAGAEKVGVSSGGDKALGETIMGAMMDNAPAIFDLKEMVWNFAAKHDGVIHTYFGRRLVYPNLVPDYALEEARRLIKEGVVTDETPARLARSLTSRAQRQVFNAMLQGTAADTLKILSVGTPTWLMNDIRAREELLWDMQVLMEMGAVKVAHGYGAWKAAAIHDELQFYAPVEAVEPLKADLKLLFSAPLLSHVPIAGDPASGANWQDTH